MILLIIDASDGLFNRTSTKMLKITTEICLTIHYVVQLLVRVLTLQRKGGFSISLSAGTLAKFSGQRLIIPDYLQHYGADLHSLLVSLS